jgi:hypothetical protein
LVIAEVEGVLSLGRLRTPKDLYKPHESVE